MIPEVVAAQAAGACSHWWRDRPFLHDGHCCMAEKDATCHQAEGMAAFRGMEEIRKPLAELEAADPLPQKRTRR